MTSVFPNDFRTRKKYPRNSSVKQTDSSDPIQQPFFVNSESDPGLSLPPSFLQGGPLLPVLNGVK